MNQDLVAYYRDRAKEYEQVYHKPERLDDLRRAEDVLGESFAGKQVFEIACGTGYWTERIAHRAKAILATDINDAVLDIARAKEYGSAIVTFRKEDVFECTGEPPYESLFGGFILSHIPVQQIAAFMATVSSRVTNGATVVFMDNRYVAGSNLPISRTDDYGNTYQVRHLENGTAHEILKNFPDSAFLQALPANKGSNVQLIELEYFWILRYLAA